MSALWMPTFISYSIVIPLEQGLRLGHQPFFLSLVYYSIVIPLEQGLRLRERAGAQTETDSIVIPLEQGLRRLKYACDSN